MIAALLVLFGVHSLSLAAWLAFVLASQPRNH